MLSTAAATWWDDFVAATVLPDWYNLVFFGAGGCYTTAEGDDDDLNGSLIIIANGGYAECNTLDVCPWKRSQRPTLLARFRLSHTTDIEARIGFENVEDDDYVALNARGADGDFRITVKTGGVITKNVAFPAPIALDTGWHVMELRVLGTGVGAELILDGDEGNKATVVSGDLFTLPMSMFARLEDPALTARNMYVDWWAAEQARYTY